MRGTLTGNFPRAFFLCRSLGKQYFLGLLLLIAAFQGGLASSKAQPAPEQGLTSEFVEMPEQARQVLQQTLQDPSFQPRQTRKSWEFDLPGMLGVVWEHFARWLSKHLDGLDGLLPSPAFLKPLGDFFSWIGHIILAIVGFCLDYWWLLPFALLCVVFFRMYARRRPKLVSKFDQILTESKAVEGVLSWDKIQKLYYEGNFDQVIAELRKAFREICYREFQIPYSQTDREALIRVPKDQTQAEAFRNIVRAFERRAFASRSLSEYDLAEVLGKSKEFVERSRRATGVK